MADIQNLQEILSEQISAMNASATKMGLQHLVTDVQGRVNSLAQASPYLQTDRQKIVFTVSILRESKFYVRALYFLNHKFVQKKGQCLDLLLRGSLGTYSHSYNDFINELSTLTTDAAAIINDREEYRRLRYFYKNKNNTSGYIYFWKPYMIAVNTEKVNAIRNDKGRTSDKRNKVYRQPACFQKLDKGFKDHYGKGMQKHLRNDCPHLKAWEEARGNRNNDNRKRKFINIDDQDADSSPANEQTFIKGATPKTKLFKSLTY